MAVTIAGLFGVDVGGDAGGQGRATCCRGLALLAISAHGGSYCCFIFSGCTLRARSIWPREASNAWAHWHWKKEGGTGRDWLV